MPKALPIINMVGRLAISGIRRRDHPAILSVRMISSGDVTSHATVSIVAPSHTDTICSSSLTLRYGASINICDSPAVRALRSRALSVLALSGGLTGR